MKKLALLAVFGLLTLGSYAQKLGHVNTDEIINILVENDGIMQKLETRSKELTKKLQTAKEAFDNDVQYFKENLEKYSSTERELEEQELMEAQKRLIEKEQQYNQDIQDYKTLLETPIINNLKDAINKVAERGKYTYIFDISIGVIIYYKDSEDITDKVKKELGL